MGPKAIWGILRATVDGFVEDRAMTMGASMAYYTLFSLAPVLVIVIAVAGLVFGADAAQGAIVAELSEFLGVDGAKAVEEMIASARSTEQGIIATIIGVVAFLIASTTALGDLQESLNVIWRAPPAQGSTILALLRSKLFTLFTLLGLGFLLLVSLVIGAALTAFSGLLDRTVPALNAVMGPINFGVSFLITALLFALIYQVLPRVRIPWRDVIAGAVLAALLFMLGRWAIAYYIGQTNLASSYGAAGATVVIMVWVYYSTQILFLGAEFGRAWHEHRMMQQEPVPEHEPPAA